MLYVTEQNKNISVTKNVELLRYRIYFNHFIFNYRIYIYISNYLFIRLHLYSLFKYLGTEEANIY